MERASGDYAFVRRVVEMKRANVDSYASVRRVIEMKRTNVNYSFAESFAYIQMRIRKLRLRLVVIFSSVREELKAVQAGRVII